MTYRSNLRLIASEIDGEMDAAMQETAEDVADLAQQLAPEETGALKGSKAVYKEGDAWHASFGRDLPDGRAIYQEFGTDVMAAQPYMTPAFRNIDKLFRAKARIAALLQRHRL